MPSEERTRNSTSISLPSDVIELVDEIKNLRFDTSRSDTTRYLILLAAGELGFLPPSTVKALGLKLKEQSDLRSTIEHASARS